MLYLSMTCLMFTQLVLDELLPLDTLTSKLDLGLVILYKLGQIFTVIFTAGVCVYCTSCFNEVKETDTNFKTKGVTM